LASLGQIITATENEGSLDSLPLTQNDRRVWAAVCQQTRRFDVSWKHIAATDPIITSVKQWAEMVLAHIADDGPVCSLQHGFDMPIEEAA
jgi:hypothetical protein